MGLQLGKGCWEYDYKGMRKVGQESFVVKEEELRWVRNGGDEGGLENYNYVGGGTWKGQN